VPGSVRSSASVGCNTLIHEGATPIRNVDDILVALGTGPSHPPPASRSGKARAPRAEHPQLLEACGPQVVPGDAADVGGDQVLGTLDEKVRASIGWRPLCIEEIVERSGLPVTAVVVALDRLEQQQVVTDEDGWWARRRG